MKPGRRSSWPVALVLSAACGLCRPGHANARHQNGTGDALLLSATRQGEVILAVGERGDILRSADGGTSWRNMASPTQATLTRVVFTAPEEAFATGFDATILRSEDAGQHWTQVMKDDRADNPIFGIARVPGGGGIAVGAFGHAYASPDGIAWHPLSLPPDDADPHWNDLLSLGGAGLLLLGEAGRAMVTEDAGAHWRKLTLPVQGSLFGGLVLAPGKWLVFGLHGNVLVTSDAGATWTILPPVTTAEFLGAAVRPDGSAILVGRGGTVAVVDPDLHTATLVPQSTRESYADIVVTPQGTALAAGEAGLSLLDIPPPLQAHP
jgi:photosystem II stability/assembly factor-like uncharacterized protein